LTGWLILAVYVVGYVLLWRTVTWAVISDFGGYRPDDVDVAFGVFLGSILSLFWPFILAGLIVRSIYRARGDEAISALMPRAVQREREVSARAKRASSPLSGSWTSGDRRRCHRAAGGVGVHPDLQAPAMITIGLVLFALVVVLALLLVVFDGDNPGC